MLFTIVVITIAVAGIVYHFLSRAGKGASYSWVGFYPRGKNAGFTFKELETLRRLAVDCRLEDPASVFSSQDQLDICIRALARNVRRAGGGERAQQDFLSKLYDYRKKLEMEKGGDKAGISDTRQIDEGQGIRVLLGEQGVYTSRVAKNTSQYLIIERPVSPKLPPDFSWNGVKVSVYFWRAEDAGYVFDTEVQDEIVSKGTASLKVSHGDSLFRTQKRKSIRIKTHKSAFLYLLEGGEPSDTIELTPGLKSIVEDLSDTGCAVTVGGKARPGMRVKVQFILNNTPVCISGAVRSMEFDEAKNRSLLHVEADALPLETRNLILGEVFGMLPEEESEENLPFRVPGEDSVENLTEDRSGASGNALY